MEDVCQGCIKGEFVRILDSLSEFKGRRTDLDAKRDALAKKLVNAKNTFLEQQQRFCKLVDEAGRRHDFGLVRDEDIDAFVRFLTEAKKVDATVKQLIIDVQPYNKEVEKLFDLYRVLLRQATEAFKQISAICQALVLVKCDIWEETGRDKSEVAFIKDLNVLPYFSQEERSIFIAMWPHRVHSHQYLQFCRWCEQYGI